MFAGTVTTGGVVSCTVTWNDADDELPCVSVALHVTVVVPNANVDPDAGTHEKLATASSGSVAEATYVTTAPAELVASAVMSAGTVITGGVVSTVPVTVTWNDALEDWPIESVALQFTVVVPIGNVAPDAGTHENEASVYGTSVVAEAE